VVELETERTKLMPFSASHETELLELFRDPAIRRYLLDDMLVDADWIAAEIKSSDARFAAGNVGLWSVRVHGDERIVGFCGFREFFTPPQMQLLYGLLPAQCGRGLATEVARAVCDHAFHDLGFSQVAAATDVPNKASIRVLERLGMQRERVTEDGVEGTVFYAVTRDAWLARNASRLNRNNMGDTR